MTDPTQPPAGLTDDGLRAANQAGWNEAAEHHRAHPQFAELLANFARPGFSCLDEVATTRLKMLGVSGQSVAQLCCNNARELLSIRNMGAGRCVGFDFSQAFLDQGRELAAAAGQDLEFVQTEITAIPPGYDENFDLAVMTIGVLGWMPDLSAFFATVARVLKPGGRMFLYEDHPILNMYPDGEQSMPPQPDESYFRSAPYREDSGLDYWSGKSYDAQPVYWTFHKMSDIIMGVVGNGFRIEDFEELPLDIGNRPTFENQPEQLPLSYILIARKGN
ncbi:class I SAM-dependent methyltransferase [Denitrobaculum tricleocarpae]|uniref:Class I SAM-dependent methyltransferase n=1 Tax=Denitrobaculum tricleocarpae TaxID=2591009 RepID=A0A545TXC2_9PROT|nr:class I SAM-dependent methyltransferase [Denitrobaculum tricleocarpae]TQV81850.1 class I SAM-dependent methyltransferase [Denitrobaculum tricleocarpae]